MKIDLSYRSAVIRICALVTTSITLAVISCSDAAPACGPSSQILHSFGSWMEAVASLSAGLVEGADGALYGTTSAGWPCGAATVFRVNRDGTGYKMLHNFGFKRFCDYGRHCSTLVRGSDGALYGLNLIDDHDTDMCGGGLEYGAVFKLNPDGTGYTALHTFYSKYNVWGNPAAALVQGSDGALYGTTSAGGSSGAGTLFRLNLDGTDYTVLHEFGSTVGDGTNPSASLVQGSDGALYGTTQNGGSNAGGTVFKLNLDGTGYTVLHSFGSASDGANPVAALVQASDGTLYGTTRNAVGRGMGTIFKLNPDGNGYAVLYDFGSIPYDGASPSAPLVQGGDGALYGTTQTGGSNGVGTVFKLNLDGSGYSVLNNFGSTPDDGLNPVAALMQGSDGAFYGTTMAGMVNTWKGTVFKLEPNGTGYTLLYNFGLIPNDGASPVAALVQANDGALYGTTQSSRASPCGAPTPSGPSTLFRINPDGSGYSLLNVIGSIGYGPELVQASDGALYGAGQGSVFTINLDGTGYRVLHSFGSIPEDGGGPNAALLQATDGALYGTTEFGGSHGGGTVFKLNLDGSSYSVLYSFGSDPGDGLDPTAALIQGTDGALYGTTQGFWNNGVGSVFKLNLDGSGYQVLHKFGIVVNDGENPSAALMQASDGALFGTTLNGGMGGAGTVFTLNLDGSGYTVLHDFGELPNFYGADPNDGRNPSASLVQGSDGTLYGTTRNGGTYGLGTVFALNLDGTGYTVLYHFGAFPSDGANPAASLVLGSYGALYGTTGGGGDLGAGTAFRLSLPGVVRSLSPASAIANGPEFELTVSGPYFRPGSTVLWNAASRNTVGSVDGTQLYATIPFSDLVSSSDIETAVITVLDPEGCTSDPQLFAIVSGTVSSQQSALAPPNEVIVLATSNIADQGEELAVSACVDNVQGSELVAVTAATFAGNPTSSSVFDVGGGYVDLKVSGGDENVSVQSRFFYPSTVTGEAEESLTLLYYTGTSWAPVLSSGGVAPWREADDNLEGTLSGGCFYVVFDQSSTPKVTELSGTVFSPALLDTTPPSLYASPLPVITGQCSASITTLPTATDDSGGKITGTTSDPLTYTTPGTYILTWHYADGYGNKAQQQQTVHVQDTTPPELTLPATLTVLCSTDPLVPVTFTASVTDNCDPSPSVSFSSPSGSGFPVGETEVACTATDASGNSCETSFTVTRAALGFVGFLAPIGGADGTGGNPANPVRTFKNGSTIPVKFIASCDGAPVLTGVHRLEVIKYSNATTAAMPIDASPQDAATTGSQFRPVDGQWHFNLDTKGTGMSVGIWLLRATLSDTSQHSVWVQLK